MWGWERECYERDDVVSAPLGGLIVSNSARKSLAHETLDVAHLAPCLLTLSKEGITNPENKVLIMKTQALEET